MNAILSRFRKKNSFELLRQKIATFQSLLAHNNKVLELIADAGEMQGGDFIFDMQYLRDLAGQFHDNMREIISELNYIADNRYLELNKAYEKARQRIANDLENRITITQTPYVFPMHEIGMELSDAVGEKMARLGELRNRLDMKVPDGFAISAYACQQFFDRINVHAQITRGFDRANLSTEDAEALLAGAVRAAALPRDLKKAIMRACVSLKGAGYDGGSLAVRSSAIGEDGQLSYAGIHDSLLGVSVEDAPGAYRDVVASLFNARALEYRRTRGESLDSALMAVGVLQMVPARASGVLYTLDPNFPETDAMVVSAACGLGKMVVDGRGNIDQFTIGRNQPHEILSRNIADKNEMYRADAGVELAPVPAERRSVPAVPDAFLADLAAAALRIEKYMKSALDIEWAQDENGALVILQARPLRIQKGRTEIKAKVRDAVKRHEVLLADRGTIACRGIGHGTAVLVDESSRIEDLPENAVLVARMSSPHLAELVPAASAVITDKGAPTGHLATITREYRVPSIMDMEIATSTIKPGMEITVDAEENIIYGGRVDELLKYQAVLSSSFEDKREFRILSKLLKSVAPLNLKNPHAKNFTPRHCETYHDIIRFAHEKSVEHLIAGYAHGNLRNHPGCRQLKTELPLDLMVIDMGDGLATQGNAPECPVEDILCAPLFVLLEGLSAPGAWSTEPAGMDFGSFMSSATGKTPMGAQPGAHARNLAIVSDRYLNLNLHLGYHFNQVVCYVSDTRNDNYIHFRFVGGMTDLTRRSRRVKTISMILQKQDFVVDTRGDFITARMTKFDAPEMLERLRMLGCLIGFTRQLDVKMKSDAMIERAVDQFLTGLYCCGDKTGAPGDTDKP